MKSYQTHRGGFPKEDINGKQLADYYRKLKARLKGIENLTETIRIDAVLKMVDQLYNTCVWTTVESIRHSIRLPNRAALGRIAT
jgi:hypothetical protein